MKKTFRKLIEYFIRDYTEGKNRIDNDVLSNCYSFQKFFNENNFNQLNYDDNDFNTIAEKATARKLTDNMKGELDALIEKVSQPFELGKTAKNYIETVWLEKEYNYISIVWTDEIMKGMLHEQDSIGLLVEKDGVWRSKNTENFKDEFFTGTPDIILHNDFGDIVEDVKTSWDLKTFFNVREIPELYFAQAQVYMNLTGAKEFRLHYCLVNTSPELIQSQIKRVFYRFGAEEENPHFEEFVETYSNNHKFDQIPLEKRIKTFEIKYDQNYVDELIFRAKAGLEYYKTLSL